MVVDAALFDGAGRSKSRPRCFSGAERFRLLSRHPRSQFRDVRR
jgi:hypothetical protein